MVRFALKNYDGKQFNSIGYGLLRVFLLLFKSFDGTIRGKIKTKNGRFFAAEKFFQPLNHEKYFKKTLQYGKVRYGQVTKFEPPTVLPKYLTSYVSSFTHFSHFPIYKVC